MSFTELERRARITPGITPPASMIHQCPARKRQRSLPGREPAQAADRPAALKPPSISGRHDYGFSQAEFSWTACACLPRILEERDDTFLKLVELLSVEFLIYDRIATASPSAKGST